MKNKRALFLALLSTLTLSGCVSSSPDENGKTTLHSYDQRTFDTVGTDQTITHQAQLKLTGDRIVDENAHIVVASFNRIVLLVGQAPTPELRERATKLVQEVPKIRRIYNEITIAKPISAIKRSNDTWITTKVKTGLVTHAGLDAAKVKVVTENGVVYLMGIVTHDQANIAVDAARKVSGVKRVVKLFEYQR
jgi:osmotically-inducible protein OsmY